MQKIVQPNRQVAYGSFDEPIEWNYADFKLLDFFNREVKGLRKALAYHQFNYIAVMNPQFIIGIGIVDLNYCFSLFAFYCDLTLGMQFKYFKKGLFSKALRFERNPDSYMTEFKDGASELLILKSNDKGELEIHCNVLKKLIVNGVFSLGWDNRPLRVLNPSDPNCFTFTEKCSPLQPKSLDICLNGKPLELKPGDTAAVFDWSGGYLRRETNWLWACMAGKSAAGTPIGANLASLVNESFYPEDAVWFGSQRRRLHNVIFDIDRSTLSRPWHLFTETDEVDLTFTPKDEFKMKMNLPPVLKIFFRQFVGTFDGFFTRPDGTREAVHALPGLTEFHRSLW